MPRTRSFLILAAALLTGTTARRASEVAGEFQDLYGELSTATDDFYAVTHQGWDGAPSPVTFSANLLSCHSGLGPALLTPDRLSGVRQEWTG